jgi:hypothetical protein
MTLAEEMKTLLTILGVASIPLVDAGQASVWNTPNQEDRQLDSVGEGFEFKINQDFTFIREASLPLTVKIHGSEGVAYSKTVGEGTSYDLSCVLKPRRYRIKAEPFDDKKYWGCPGGYVTIKEDGTMSSWAQKVVFRMKMEPIAPINRVELDEARPTLKWQPIGGAKSYRIGWFEHDSDTHEVINRGVAEAGGRTDWTFDFDLVEGRTYEWSVDAIDGSGERFAYYSASYFKTTKAN